MQSALLEPASRHASAPARTPATPSRSGPPWHPVARSGAVPPLPDTDAPMQAALPQIRCRLCTCLLGAEDDDDPALALCGACSRRPEARRLGLPQIAARGAGAARPAARDRARPGGSALPAREFTEAERSLIRKVHGFMPAQQLLALLNERLACDLGPDATPYGMDQLHAQIGAFAAPVPAGAHGWAAQRKLIAQARRSGVLAAVTEQLIVDFAVVFSLNPKQVLYLRDTLLQPEDEQ